MFARTVSVNNVPIVTLLVIVLCVILQVAININAQHIDGYTSSFCESDKSDEILNVFKERSASGYTGADRSLCKETLLSLSYGHNFEKQLNLLQSGLIAYGYNGLSYKQRIIIKNEYEIYLSKRPIDLTNTLGHFPGTYNVLTMLTGSFVHSSWEHLWFNMLYFVVFGCIVEMITKNKSTFARYLLAGTVLAGLLNDILHTYHLSNNTPSHGLSVIVCLLAGTYLVQCIVPSYRRRLQIRFSRVTLVAAFVLSLYILIQNARWLLMYGDHSQIDFKSHLYGYFVGAILFSVTSYFSNRAQKN